MDTSLVDIEFSPEQGTASGPLEALMEASGNATFHLNEQGQVTFTSRFSRDEGPGRHIRVGGWFTTLFDEAIQPQVRAAFERVLNHGEVAQFRAPVQQGTGGVVEWKLCRYSAAHKRGVLVVVQSTTAQQELQLRVQQMSKYDVLTSLPNRTTAQTLCREMLEASRVQGHPFAFAMVNVTGVTRINNALGNAVGDKTILQVASRLESTVAGRGVVARTGPVEFCVLFHGNMPREALLKCLRHAVAMIEAPYPYGTHSLHVKALGGLTLATSAAVTEDDVFSTAAQALSQAKEFSQVVYLETSHGGIKAAKDFMRIEAALHQGVRNGELYLVYQPLVSQAGLYGVEALMRWRRADGVEVSPGVFVPVAEESKLIQMLGEWALRRAAHEVAAFNKANGLSLQVSVNVSPVQFLNPRFLQLVESVLKNSGLPPELLQLEVTEGALMSAPEQVEPLLRMLAGMHIKIALDDFGTGYSSLAYLKRFAISTLKIDQIFVRELPGSEADLVVCSVISDLAHKLKLRVVAEGIETREQLEALRGIVGDGGFQGYLFGKPAPLSALVLARDLSAVIFK